MAQTGAPPGTGDVTIDVELTLNRFGFKRVAANKLQLGPLRLSGWLDTGKHFLSVEVNWKR
jgi:hypothetical protein